MEISFNWGRQTTVMQTWTVSDVTVLRKAVTHEMSSKRQVITSLLIAGASDEVTCGSKLTRELG